MTDYQSPVCAVRHGAGKACLYRAVKRPRVTPLAASRTS
jgi:hypothetical protein